MAIKTKSKDNSVNDTLELARRIRLHALNMTSSGGGSHIASCLSISDLIAVLYGESLKIDPKQPELSDRDRFILSKGHAGAAVYAALAELGFFPTARLSGHYKDGTEFSGHVSHKGIPGVELSTGSLGHGLGIGAGMALAAKKLSAKHRVFVLLSDGELDEGSNWEALLFAGHHKLNNLVAIIDYNKIQSLDTVENTLGLEPLRQKLESFRWTVAEIDGHDHSAIKDVFEKKEAISTPLCVIAHTIKGKGISFMENTVLWHYRIPRGDEYTKALAELNS